MTVFQSIKRRTVRTPVACSDIGNVRWVVLGRHSPLEKNPSRVAEHDNRYYYKILI